MVREYSEQPIVRWEWGGRVCECYAELSFVACGVECICRHMRGAVRRVQKCVDPCCDQHTMSRRHMGAALPLSSGEREDICPSAEDIRLSGNAHATVEQA